MTRNDRNRDGQLRERRQRVAFEAARLIAEHGIQRLPPGQAARRAQARASTTKPRCRATRDATTRCATTSACSAATRRPATCRACARRRYEAMGFFAAFEPRLVGAVLDGTRRRALPVRCRSSATIRMPSRASCWSAACPASTWRERRLRLYARGERQRSGLAFPGRRNRVRSGGPAAGAAAAGAAGRRTTSRWRAPRSAALAPTAGRKDLGRAGREARPRTG